MNTPRSGNAIFVTLVTLGGIAMTMALVTDSLVTVSKKQISEQLQRKALDATESVAISKETFLNKIAASGDPAAFVDKTNPDIYGNYGEQNINGVTVRWKIEPAIIPSIAPVEDIGWSYITNPSSDTSFVPQNPQQPNEVTYLYRIAAEGTIGGADGDPITRVQSIRFASVDKTPLFRYVLFYAKKGPKGDLELSHGPGIKIAGSIHSNGAIYLGSSPVVGDWSSVSTTTPSTVITDPKNPLNGYTDIATVIGPDQFNKKVRVSGIDGIFRLSKSSMYMGFNEFPMQGTIPSGGNVSSGYDFSLENVLGEGIAANSHYKKPLSTGSFLEKMHHGTVINPNRVKGNSGFITRDSGDDNQRLINGIPIRGISKGGSLGKDTAQLNEDKANDTRDNDRDNYEWKKDSLKSTPPGFTGYARSQNNGGSVIEISKNLQGRPFEAQAILMPTYNDDGTMSISSDGTPTGINFDDPTTLTIDESEHHFKARPIFNNGGTLTTSITSDSQTEIPETYMLNALGSPNYLFKRNVTDYTIPGGVSNKIFSEWTVVDKNGNNIVNNGVASLNSKVGFIIRERPMPDYNLWYQTPIAVGSDNYLPYTYGKQTYPDTVPFYRIDITSNFSGVNNQSSIFNGIGINKISNVDPRQVQYKGNGVFLVNSAHVANDGIMVGNVSFTEDDGTTRNYPRNYSYYSSNWQFIHLRPASEAYYHDTLKGMRKTSLFSPSNNNTSYDGNEETGVSVDNSLATSWAMESTNSRNKTSCAFSNSSMRLEGLLTVDEAGSYVFSLLGDDRARLWINDDLGVNVTGYNGDQPYASTGNTKSYSFSSGQKVRITIDCINTNGGGGVKLGWSKNGESFSDVPIDTKMSPRKFGTTFDDNIAYRSSAFKSIECTIDSMDGGSNTGGVNARKSGIMIRPASSGVAPLLSGSEKYIALLYSPDRGVFVERRDESSKYITISGRHFVGKSVGSTAGVTTSLTSVRSGLASTSYVKKDLVEVISESAILNGTTATPSTTLSNWYSIPEGAIGDVEIGPLIVTRSSKRLPEKKYTFTYNINVDSSTLDSNAKFVASDVNKTFNFYNTNNTSSRLNQFRITALLSDYSVRIISDSVKVYGTVDARTGLPEGYTSTTHANGVTISTIVDDKRTFYTKSVKAGSKTLNKSQIKKFLEDKYGGSWEYKDKGSYEIESSNFIINAAEEPSSDYPIITNKTFSINRQAGLPPDMLLNPFITRSMKWFSTVGSDLQSQFLPKPNNAEWTTNAVANMPISGGIRPDEWSTSDKVTSTSNKSALNTGLTAFLDDITIDDPLPIKLKISRIGTSSNFELFYKSGSSNWENVKDDNNVNVTFDIISFQPNFHSTTVANSSGLNANPASENFDLLVGLCSQSGSTSQILTTKFSEVSISTSIAAAGTPSVSRNTIDKYDFDQCDSTVPSPLTRYLASQYQVFYGPYDITQDFFMQNQTDVTKRIANETWIYNQRSFWSQSKWWNDNTSRSWSKDTGADEFPTGQVTNRELLARQSILDINFKELQNYIKTRTLKDAISKPILGVSPGISDTTSVLGNNFNGLFYFARTNRYPYNPNPHDVDSINPLKANPWNTLLPNDTQLNNVKSLTDSTNPNVKSMMPFMNIIVSPPFKDKDLPLAVRIFNGDVIDWQYPESTVPEFGNSKCSIVSPNQIMIKGNFNWKEDSPGAGPVWNSVKSKGSSSSDKPVPVAIIADKVIFLSNNFKDEVYKIPGIKVTASASTGVTGISKTNSLTGVLGVASDTNYWTSIVTNNNPTTRQSVMRMEASSVIGLMEYLEDWTDQKFNYCGSIVVLDTRRRSEDYMLEAPKDIGWCPFGFAINNSSTTGDKWKEVWEITSMNKKEFMNIAIPYAQLPPNRNLTFNYDLLTESGTPPFTPFGVGVSGRGGWTKVIR